MKNKIQRFEVGGLPARLNPDNLAQGWQIRYPTKENGKLNYYSAWWMTEKFFRIHIVSRIGRYGHATNILPLEI